MATASLGTLSVEIGADTRKLQQGERTANAALSRIESQMQNVRNVAVRLSAALGTVFAVRSLANLGKQAIDAADQMSKLSQQIGVSVEKFSALSYAAEQSGMSTEQLGRVFRNVARNMQAAAQAPSDFSRSLDALGVSWREASGQFRNADDLLLDVAEQFANMQDGAGKTALAMKIFGEEMGPKLIPLLDQGKSGIRELTEEARRLGIVIDADTGAAAERFNSVLTRLEKIFSGVVNTTMAKVLPSFETLAERISNMVSDSGTLQRVTEDLAIAMKSLATGALAAAGGIGTLVEFGKQFLSLFSMEFGKANKTIQEEFDEFVDHFSKSLDPLRSTLELMDTLWNDQARAVNDTNLALDEHQKRMPPVVQSIATLAQAQREHNEAMLEGQRIIQDLQSPQERMIAVQERLNHLFQVGAIDAKTLGLAMQQATMAASSAYAGLVSNVAGSLSQIFNKNKAVAIAAAIANTAEAITKTLAQYGGTPWGWANAAAAAAAGAAQIATIRRTSPSGGGTAPSMPTGGAVAPPAQPVDQTSPARSPGTVLRVETVGLGNLITREVFENILEQIMDYQRDGGAIILERV